MLHIELAEVGNYAGRIVDTSGDPIAEAQLTVQSMNTSSFGERNADHIYLYEALRRQYTVKTLTDGTFVLPDFPRTGTASGKVVAPNQATVYVTWDVTVPITIPLEPAGAVAGKVRFEADRLLPGRYQLPNTLAAFERGYDEYFGKVIEILRLPVQHEDLPCRAELSQVASEIGVLDLGDPATQPAKTTRSAPQAEDTPRSESRPA
jgi:hypothetical protein